MTRAERNKRLVTRLEMLWEKQRHRQPTRRTRRIPSEAQRAKQAKVLTDFQAMQKRQTQAMQARMLTQMICLQSLRNRRPSLRPEIETAFVLRMVRNTGGTIENPPARTAGVEKAIRALDRAASLLLCLSVRHVERERGE